MFTAVFMAVFTAVVTTVFTVVFEGDFIAYFPVAFTATSFFLKFHYWETGNLLKKQTKTECALEFALHDRDAIIFEF